MRRKALNQNPLKSMRAGQHIMTAFLDQKKSKRYPGIYSWRIATCHIKSISITRFFLFKKKPFCMLTLDQKQSDPAFYAQKKQNKKKLRDRWQHWLSETLLSTERYFLTGVLKSSRINELLNKNASQPSWQILVSQRIIIIYQMLLAASVRVGEQHHQKQQ